MALRADDVDLGRDRDLVARYQAGDPSAFDALYSQYFDRLHRYCRKHTASDHDAEELAQEAFVRALRAMPTLQGERHFYPWLTVIARRVGIDNHRKNGRVDLTDQPELPTIGLDVEHLFDAVDHEYLRQAMENLGPRHREVLAMREAQGMSYAQIATDLEVPVTTVEALLHRARKALKREYLKVGGERRNLWGLPVLGWFARKATDLRARVGDRMIEFSAMAAPAVAGVATVAVVLTPQPEAAVAAPTAAAVTVDATDTVTPVDAPVAVDVADDIDTPTASEATTGDTGLAVDDTETAAAVDAPVAEIYVGERGREQAETNARNMETSGSVGPATVGVDVAPLAGVVTGDSASAFNGAGNTLSVVDSHGDL